MSSWLLVVRPCWRTSRPLGLRSSKSVKWTIGWCDFIFLKNHDTEKRLTGPAFWGAFTAKLSYREQLSSVVALLRLVYRYVAIQMLCDLEIRSLTDSEHAKQSTTRSQYRGKMISEPTTRGMAKADFKPATFCILGKRSRPELLRLIVSCGSYKLFPTWLEGVAYQPEHRGSVHVLVDPSFCINN